MSGQDERNSKQAFTVTHNDLERQTERTKLTSRQAARRAAEPPKDVEPTPFVHKESVPVRPVKNYESPEIVARWNSPESLNEQVRVADDRILKFRNGELLVTSDGDDEALRNASRYVAGGYVRGDLDQPQFDFTTNPPTRWWSVEALRRYQVKQGQDRA